jgi:F0F1-type ATP synthase epsilon subunit
MNSKLTLAIWSKERILFTGDVLSVTSVNRKGKFDILPMHTNFISLVKDRILARLLNGKFQEFPISEGVLRVTENKVEVFL